MTADYWPPKERLAQLPTPMHRLARFDQSLDARLWLKRDDLTGFVLSGNKVRKLEYVLAYAKRLGVTRIITCGGVQSNHCRATAFACAQLGLACHLVLRDTQGRNAGGNFLLDQMAGADCSIYSVKEYTGGLSKFMSHWAGINEAKGEVVLEVPTGASDGLGIWGYAAAAFELIEDFQREGIAPQVVACATGSGGTQAGLALGFALAGYEVDLVGYAVCDDAAYFDRKVAADIADWQRRNPDVCLQAPLRYRTVDAYVGAGYAKPGEADLALALEMARTEGVLLDPVYTGKAFHGFITDVQNGMAPNADVVFVHTGGGFGVFPYVGEFERQWSER